MMGKSIRQIWVNSIFQTKNEEQGKLAEEIMEQYQAATTKIKKLELDLDTALREKVLYYESTLMQHFLIITKTCQCDIQRFFQ